MKLIARLVFGLSFLPLAAADDKPAPPAPQGSREAIRRALRIVDDIEKIENRLSFFLDIAEAQIRVGDRADAERMLDKVEPILESFGIDHRYHDSDVSTYPWSRLALARAKLGDEAAARAIFRRQFDTFLRKRRYRLILDNCMMSIFDQVEAGDRTGAIGRIDELVAFIQSDKSREIAREFANQKPPFGEGPNGLDRLDFLYFLEDSSAIGRFRAYADDYEGALRDLRRPELFSKDRTKGWKISYIRMFSMSVRHPSRGELVDRFLEEASTALKSEDHPMGRLFLTANMVHAYSELNRFDEAIRLARTIDLQALPVGKILSLGIDQKRFAYNSIASAQSRAGDREGVWSTAQEFAAIYREREDFKAWLREKKDFSETNSIEWSLLRVGDFAHVREFPKLIRKDVEPNLAVLLVLAQAQTDAGDVEGGRQLWHELLRDHEKLEPMDLAEIQVRLGDIPEAIRTFKGIADDKNEPDRLIALIADIARSGDETTALKLADELKTVDGRAGAFLVIDKKLVEREESRRHYKSLRDRAKK